MLEIRKIEEAQKNAIASIKKGTIVKTNETKYIEFFLKNAKDSLDSAKILFELTNNEKLRQTINIPNFNGFFGQ